MGEVNCKRLKIMVYLEDGTLGFVNETTFGVRVEENGADATTVTWALGEYIGNFTIPIEKPALIDRGKFTSYDYGELKAGAKIVEFPIKYMLMEGHSLWYVLGKMTEAGGDNARTHTITGMTPADGVELPSRTFHIQLESLTTPKMFDICGCVTQEIDIGGTMKEPGIQVTEKMVAQRITDEGGTQVVAGEVLTAAIDYTAAPAYMDSTLTVEDFYYLEYINISFEGGAAVEMFSDLVSWNINIKNEFIPRRANRVGSDNYGRTINNYIGAFYLKSRRITITLNVLPSDKTIKMMNAQQDQKVDNAVSIGFTRTKSDDDIENTIVWDFDHNTAVCPITDITAMANFALANDQTWTFILQPKALVNVIVTDAINKTPGYGVVPT